MVTIKDGPGKGAILMIPRAPRLLRIVVKKKPATLFDPVSQTVASPANQFLKRTDVDCLDQPEDTAAADESVHVYRRVSHDGRAHLNLGGGRGGFYAVAEYEHVPVDGEQLRDRARWIAWATEHQHLSPANTAKVA